MRLSDEVPQLSREAGLLGWAEWGTPWGSIGELFSQGHRPSGRGWKSASVSSFPMEASQAADMKHKETKAGE